MLKVRAYHRPQSVDEALQLLARTDGNSAILGGGTQLLPTLDDGAVEVVDLQAVGLDTIEHDGGRLSLGATVRLQAMVEAERLPEVLRVLARREGPNTFRHQGTVGGAVVAAGWESEFVAGLLAYEAEVTVQTTAGAATAALDDFLADPPAARDDQGILVSISLARGGQAAHACVARTPADRPIVAAIARRDGAGTIRLALSGVAATPVLVEPENVDNLVPPADFRGSSEYRKEMAAVLSARVLAQL